MSYEVKGHPQIKELVFTRKQNSGSLFVTQRMKPQVFLLVGNIQDLEKHFILLCRKEYTEQMAVV